MHDVARASLLAACRTRAAFAAAALTIALVPAGSACGGAQVDVFQAGPTTVHAIRATTWNAYLLEQDDALVLFDTGSEADLPVLRDGLEQIGVAPSSIDAIALSHAHFDHAGGAGAMLEDGVPALIVHDGDAARVRAGESGPATVTSWEGHLVKLVVAETYAPAAPTQVPTAALDLDALGVRATLLPVPGHTPGSVAAVLDDGVALVGDLFRTDGERAITHMFSDDLEADRRHVDGLLDDGIQSFHVAHGPAVDAAAVRAWIDERPLQAPGLGACGDHC